MHTARSPEVPCKTWGFPKLPWLCPFFLGNISHTLRGAGVPSRSLSTPVLCQTLSTQLAPRRNQRQTRNGQVAWGGAEDKASTTPERTRGSEARGGDAGPGQGEDTGKCSQNGEDGRDPGEQETQPSSSSASSGRGCRAVNLKEQQRVTPRQFPAAAPQSPER